MADPARSRRGLWIVLSVAVLGVCLASVIDHAGAGWVGRYRSTLIAAVWLYLPLPFVLKGGRPLSRFGIGPGSGLRGLLDTLAVSVAVLIPFYLVFFHMYPIRWLGQGFNLNLLSVAAAQFIVVALPEEFFFRGWLQTELESYGGRRWRILGADLGLGWLAASAIFALAHMFTMPTAFRAMVFFPALLFGWARTRTRTVHYAALMHWLFNLTFLIAQRMAV